LDDDRNVIINCHRTVVHSELGIFVSVWSIIGTDNLLR
jgi:hypothetical protein